MQWKPIKAPLVIAGGLFPLEDVDTHAIDCSQYAELHMNRSKRGDEVK